MHPRRQLNEKQQHLDEAQVSLVRSAKAGLRTVRAACHNLSQRLLLVRPAKILIQQRHALRDLDRRLGEQVRLHLKTLDRQLSNSESRLRLLSPQNVLERGYSITSDAVSGKVLRQAKETKPGQRLKTQLQSGEIQSVVVD